MANGRADAVLARVSAEFGGVFDRRHARRSGLSDDQIRHRVAVGLWIEMLPGVYRHASTPGGPALMRRAATLWAGPKAVLSHSSAAALWEMEGVRERVPEITVPLPAHPQSKLVVVHRSQNLTPLDCARQDGLPCTSAARTIVDLAGSLDEESLELAIESARRRRYVTIESVRERFEPIAGRGRVGARRLRSLLDILDGTAAAESKLEVKAARGLRASSLPEPIRQYWVEISGQRYRLDFVWPTQRVALECDGRAFHEFQRDRTRWRHLGTSGWRVLPVTWRDVTRDWPSVVADLTVALGLAA